MPQNKNEVISIAVLIGIIVIAMIGAEFLYFRPAESLDRDTTGEKLQIVGSQKQFKDIEEKLLANEKFQSLGQIGPELKATDAIGKGQKDNPFIEPTKK